MARVDVYGSMSNNQRTVTMGGRNQCDSIQVELNTDNGSRSDCSIQVDAQVLGDKHYNGKTRKTCDCGHKWSSPYPNYDEACPKCDLLRQGQDRRRSAFIIDLPDQEDDNCKVYVECTRGGHGKGDTKDLPESARYQNVFLPGGYSLAYMLHCVKLAQNAKLTSEAIYEASTTVE